MQLPPKSAMALGRVGRPEVQPPKREGFGSLMIVGNVRDELGGNVTLDYRAGGLVCSIEIPLEDAPADTAQDGGRR